MADNLVGRISDTQGNYSFDGLPTGDHLIRFVMLGYETIVRHISLADGEDRQLNVAMPLIAVPTPIPFDPWVYDVDADCFIGLEEAVQAGNDAVAGLIAEEQAAEVRALWENQVRNPACAISPPPPPPPPTPTNYLSMGKAELYSYLVDGSVANDWWAMSYADRKQLGLKIIQWWSVEWFGYPLRGRARGEPNCAGPPNCSPWESGCMIPATTGMENESALRYCLFTDHTVSPTDIYWWRKADDKWYCHNPGESFGLPTAVAIGSADWLNALQIGEDVGELDSWIFFQITYNDIKPGGLEVESR